MAADENYDADEQLIAAQAFCRGVRTHPVGVRKPLFGMGKRCLGQAAYPAESGLRGQARILP